MSTTKEARRTLLSVLLVGLATTHMVRAEETNKSSQLPLSSDCNVAAFYMWLGNDAQTYKFLDAALKKNPKDAMAYLFRGKEHVWHEEYKLALSDFQRAILLGYPRIDGLERIAYCYFVSGQIQQGIDVCTEILRLDPHSHMAYENRAKGFALLKKPDLERADLVALKSTSLSSVEYLLLSHKEKDAQKKRDLCRKAVAVDPKCAEGYLKLASIQSCDDPVQSITDCNKALQLEPNSLIARIERAKAFAFNGQFQEADQDLSIVLAQAPECKRALFERAECALALHHTDRALEDINKLMLLSKQSASSKGEKNPAAAMQGTLKQYDFRACVYFIDKNYAKALADCNQCMKLAAEAHAPPSLKTYLVRAAVYRAMGNDQNAVQDFTRVLEKYPGNEELYLARGGCYLRMKQYQKALNDFKKVGEDSSAAGFAHYFQSECLLKLGQKPLALQELQKSQKLGYVPESGLTAPTGKVKPGSPLGSPAQLDKKLELWIIKHK